MFAVRAFRMMNYFRVLSLPPERRKFPQPAREALHVAVTWCQEKPGFCKTPCDIVVEIVAEQPAVFKAVQPVVLVRHVLVQTAVLFSHLLLNNSSSSRNQHLRGFTNGRLPTVHASKCTILNMFLRGAWGSVQSWRVCARAPYRERGNGERGRVLYSPL